MVEACKEGGLMVIIGFIKGEKKMHISETRSRDRLFKNPYLLGILFARVCPPMIMVSGMGFYVRTCCSRE